MILDDLSLLTVSFNNNIITGMMIKSFMTQCGRLPKKVIVVDNGTALPVDDAMKRVFTVIDNYKHKLLPDEHQPSRNHGAAIDYALKHVIKTKWCLLADNDILFKPTIVNLLNDVSGQYDIYGEIGWDITPPDRLYPYLCLINVEKFNREKCNYFVRDRYIRYSMPGCSDMKLYNHHDTGCSFYEDICATWKIKNVHINDFAIHLKGGMLKHKDVYKWLSEHEELFT